MKLVAKTDLKNNVYKVNLAVLDITDTDKEKISDFGEIVVNVGGVITGKEMQEKFIPVQEPVTEIVTEKQMVDETQLVFEADGVTPVLEADGVTQKTQVVQVEKDVDVVKPVLDADGNPVTKDKVDAQGEIIYQLIEEEVEVVLADLGKVLRQLPSDFPVVRDFAFTEYGEKTEQIALAYIELVKTELQAKIDLLENETDGFSGVVEYQL